MVKLGLNLSSIIPDSSQACPASFSPFYLGGLRAAHFTSSKEDYTPLTCESVSAEETGF